MIPKILTKSRAFIIYNVIITIYYVINKSDYFLPYSIGVSSGLLVAKIQHTKTLSEVQLNAKRVCSSHFTESDFKQHNSFLLKHAIPIVIDISNTSLNESDNCVTTENFEAENDSGLEREFNNSLFFQYTLIKK